jgi:hypothetical protein
MGLIQFSHYLIYPCRQTVFQAIFHTTPKHPDDPNPKEEEEEKPVASEQHAHSCSNIRKKRYNS